MFWVCLGLVWGRTERSRQGAGKPGSQSLLYHFTIQDHPFNHSVPQFPHPWLYLTSQLHREGGKFKGGTMTQVDTLWESTLQSNDVFLSSKNIRILYTFRLTLLDFLNFWLPGFFLCILLSFLIEPVEGRKLTHWSEWSWQEPPFKRVLLKKKMLGQSWGGKKYDTCLGPETLRAHAHVQVPWSLPK